MNRGRAVLSVLFVPLALILWFAEPLLLLVGQDAVIAGHAQTYI